MCLILRLVLQQFHSSTSACHFLDWSPLQPFITMWFISGFGHKQLIFETYPLTHSPNFSAVQTCRSPFVPRSWGSWLMFIIAVGHLHFRPIFHPIYFSSSKERHFDVPQISLWLGLSTGKDWFPLVLLWRGRNEGGKIPVEQNPNGYGRSRGELFETHSAESLIPSWRRTLFSGD